MSSILGPFVAFAGGVGATASILVAVQDLRHHKGAEVWALARIRLGLAIIIGLISYVIADAGFRLNQVNWRTWVYVAGLSLAVEGYITLLVIRHRKGHRT